MTSWVVDERVAGERADVALAHLAHVPRSAAQRALRDGAVTVAGRRVRPSHRLEGGDVLSGEVAIRETGPPRAEAIDVEIVYEDDRVMVVSKPPGLVSHPAAGAETGTLVNALLSLGRPLALAGTERPGIVHRLDKDTSGLLLVAKDDLAHEHLVTAMRERSIDRRYLALVKGALPSDTGTVDAPLDRHPARRTQMAVAAGGRPAVTHWTVMAVGEGASLVEVKLETGRTHQIRVHMAHLGHPVLGDRTYGGATEAARDLGLERTFLHAWKLSFPHPDDRWVHVTDPLPDDLVAVLARGGIAAPSPG